MVVKVKAKIKDGKIYYGAIDEDGNTVLDFSCKSIKEYGNYLLCENYDNTSILYFRGDREIREVLNQNNSDYKILEHIENDTFIALKNGKVGIIRISPFKNKKINIEYRFGKADEIIKEDDEVKLIKHQKNGTDLIGFYNDKIYGTLDPIYTSIKKEKYEMNVLPHLPHNDDHYSDYCDDKANTIYYVIVSKIKSGKELYGIKQVILNRETEDFILSDFIPCEYTKIENNNNQILILTKDICGKQKKGYVCYEIAWDMRYSYGWTGYPHLNILMSEECQYDNIKTKAVERDFNTKSYINLENDNKKTIKFVSFNNISGDYHLDGTKIRPCYFVNTLNNSNWYNSIEAIGGVYKYTCYDMFFGKKDNGTDIIKNDRDFTNGMISLHGNYVSLTPIKSLNSISAVGFIATNTEGKKQYINFYLGKIITSNFYKDIKTFHIDKENFGFVATKDDDSKDVFKILYNADWCCELIKVKENIDKVQIYNGFYEIYDKYGNKKSIYGLRSSFLFDCQKTDIVEYFAWPSVYKLIDQAGNIKLKLCNTNNNQEEFKKKLDNMTFKSFDKKNIENEKNLYVYEIEDKDKSLKKYLSYIDFKTGNVDTLFSGNFNIEGFSHDLSRTIISVTDNNITKFGIIENNKGRIVIPFDYSNVSYNNENDTFICEYIDDTGNKSIYDIDKDGFQVIDENINEKSNILVKSLKNNK